MTPIVGCETVRPRLGELVDGELGVADQVLVEAHIRSCRSCAAFVADLQEIGRELRHVAFVMLPAIELDALVTVASGRAQAEDALSWTMRLRRACDDRRVLWSLAGATCGVLLCAVLTAGVVIGLEMQAANSLASVMRVLASPGSDSNPLLLDARMLPPRLAIPAYPDDAPELTSIPSDDAVYAIAATVTRQGKLSDYELLTDHGREPAGHGAHPGEAASEAVAQAVARLRFAPAQAGGEPVAVSLVWVVARTTVRATAGDALSSGLPRRRS